MRPLLMIVALTLALLLPMSLGAQSFQENPVRRPGKKFWMSVAALGIATFADAYSSRGRVERNPLLQNEHGRFSAGRAMMIKSATAAGVVGLELWMMRRHPGPGTERASTFANFASAGIFAGVAVYNSGNSRVAPSGPPSYLSAR
jgi:hypothetical protein